MLELEGFKDFYLSHSTLQSNLLEYLVSLVDIKDTIKGFNMIMDGELDHLPEAAFNLKGTIEEAIEAGEKMIAEAK